MSIETDTIHFIEAIRDYTRKKRPLRSDEWYDAEDLAAIGISENRLSQWRKPVDRGGEGLESVKLKKILYYGEDIHEILLRNRTPG